MIVSLGLQTDSFAARRKSMLERTEERLRPAVELALVRVGLPGWSAALVDAALAQFDRAVELEYEGGPSGVIDDLRAEFGRLLRETLEKAKRDEDFATQADRLTRWVAVASINAATEAVVAVDPDQGVGLEWVSMGDEDVRASHREAHGQVIPLGGTFEVEGVQMHYPGEPVGPPSLWMNCRCMAQPTMLTEATGTAETFAADDAPPSTTVVVALPPDDDPIRSVSSDDAHATLLFLGDLNEEGRQTIIDAVSAFTKVSAAGPLEDSISGTATLGDSSADVVLLDARGLSLLREALLADESVRALWESVEQYPTWIPHVTLGYPDSPRLSDNIPESVTFDRLAVWSGEDRTEFRLGESEVEIVGDSTSVRAAATIEEEAEVDEQAPEIPEEDLYLPVPWHGVLAPEGTPSGDGRQFADGALRNRDLPLPLKWMPVDAEGHDGSVVVGRIDRIWRQDGKVYGEGVFDHSANAYEAIRQIANEMIRGVSVDVDDATAALDENDEHLTVFSSARIAAATLCAIPAFAEAYVALGPFMEEGDAPDGEPDVEAEEPEYDLVPRASADATTFAISESEWDGSAGRYTDEQWHKACLIHLHDGKPTSKDQCKLPVKEPNGDLSRAGVHAAAARLNQVDAPPEQISRAKSALRSFYKDLEEEPPEVVTAALEDNAPGRLEDGSAPKCQYGDEPATQYVLHSEGMAYIPACDEHIEQAKADAAASAPDGEPDEGNIDRIGAYAAFAPVPRKTKDGPGWITHPKPTKRITDYWVDGVGAAKIGWGIPGDFNRCRVQLAKYVQNPEWLAGLCANLHYRALRTWPGQAHAGRTTSMSDSKSLTASASVRLVETQDRVLPADWFRDPEFSQETPITVTEDGRIFGHLATWGVCHIGIADQCVEVPQSKTDYAYFLTGEVDTDAGPVAVGQVSLGGGHARDGLGVMPTLAHYDSTSSAVADVTVGEDEFGVWVAGALRPEATEKDVRDLRAAGALSGDWREVIVRGQSSYELVAALAVNVPGFPIPRTSVATRNGRVASIVAAGIPQVVAERPGSKFNSEDLKVAVREALADMKMADERRERADRSKAALRAVRAATARKQFATGN